MDLVSFWHRFLLRQTQDDQRVTPLLQTTTQELQELSNEEVGSEVMQQGEAVERSETVECRTPS